MKNRLMALLTQLNLDESEQLATLPTLRTLTALLMTASAIRLVVSIVFGLRLASIIPIAIFFSLMILCSVLLRRGLLFPSQIILPAALLFTVDYLIVTGNGLHDPIVVGFTLVMLIAGLTLRSRWPAVFTLLIILSIFAVGAAELSGSLVLPSSELTEPATPILLSLIVIAISYTGYSLTKLLDQNLRRARENEQKQINANAELLALQHELERRVASRTSELDEANRRNEQRAAQFQAITEVSRAITISENLQELLPRITDLVSQVFGFYHVGIFLIDPSGQYSVLNAANSEGGAKMLQRGHRLKVGEQGIVGYVTASGEPRISLDVGVDAVYFDNPDLPGTRSEIALPLKVTGEIIGALDVQSTEPNAFGDADVEVLSILADQVSLAIQNARLFDQTRKSLQESESVYRQYLRDVWTRLPQEQGLVGFRYSGTGAVPLEGSAKDLHAAEKSNGGPLKREVSVPVVLRGEQIGELCVQVPQEVQIKHDQLDLIKAVAERVAISIENARLFDETTRRAERERIVSDITTKIRRTNDPQDMIRTAVEELQRALGASKVEIIPQKSVHQSDK